MYLSSRRRSVFAIFFFFNDTATTEIYTLSLHDALPISGAPTEPPRRPRTRSQNDERRCVNTTCERHATVACRSHVVLTQRSEEHTSELQSLAYLVCRLLLEKKNESYTHATTSFSYNITG